MFDWTALDRVRGSFFCQSVLIMQHLFGFEIWLALMDNKLGKENSFHELK